MHHGVLRYIQEIIRQHNNLLLLYKHNLYDRPDDDHLNGRNMQSNIYIYIIIINCCADVLSLVSKKFVNLMMASEQVETCRFINTQPINQLCFNLLYPFTSLFCVNVFTVSERLLSFPFTTENLYRRSLAENSLLP